MGKGKENPPKKQGLLFRDEPLKSLGKKGKTLEKQEIPCKRKKQGIPKKSKEKKVRVGISNRLLTPCHTRLRRPPRGPFSYQGVSTRGARHSPVWEPFGRTDKIALITRLKKLNVCRARHNPEPRSEVWWRNLRWSFAGKCFWRFSPAKEARKSPSKLRRKLATIFAENFANFTLEIASAYIWVSWIQEGFTVEPPRNDSGANFHLNDSGLGPKVRVTDQKSELQTKSQSYSWADPQNPNRIAQKRDPNGVEALLQKTPLKAFLNPPNIWGLRWAKSPIANR